MDVLRCALAWALLCVASLPAGEPLRVVTASPILADLARNVAGGRAQVVSLLPPGADAHAFQPGPAEVQAIARADLVVLNGLGLDDWAARLAQQAGGRTVVRAAVGVEVLPLAGACTDHGHHHDHADHADPHAWQDVRNGQRYVEAIRDALAARDPDGTDDYRAQAELYLAQLRALDLWVRRQLAAIPEERRLLISDHDSFRYYAKAYGLRSAAIAGAAHDQEPSPQAIATLVRQLRDGRVAALFSERATPDRVLAVVAEQAGARIAGRLYADTLSPAGEGADSYIAMHVHNARTLVRALR